MKSLKIEIKTCYECKYIRWTDFEDPSKYYCYHPDMIFHNKKAGELQGTLIGIWKDVSNDIFVNCPLPDVK